MVNPRAQPVQLPLFPGAEGWRWCLLVEPEQAPPRGLVVYAPPFAEEMNKSRAMAARTARKLATAGFAVVLPDLYGTGDSPGDFADANWAQWQDDLFAAGRWLSERHADAGAAALPLFYWGLRSGCLLACEVAQREPACAGLLLWSPVASGRQMLQQFLRLRTAAHWVAASAVDGGANGPSAKGANGAKGVKDELATQGWADVAGYRLSAGLAGGLENAALLQPATGCPVHWFELTSSENTVLPPAAAAVLDRWRGAGVPADGHAIAGPSFWRATEIESAPELVARTCATLERLVPAMVADTHAGHAAPPPLPPEPASTGAGGEEALAFTSRGEALFGVLHVPPRSAPKGADGDLVTARIGIAIVVGGPQYRVGSHRQFTQLARTLVQDGWPVLRFDLRGMGDSAGDPVDFTSATADITSAIDALCARVPRLDGVVLWGLCDGASAALLHIQQMRDPRVRGVGLVNPWVRSVEGLARVHVKRYYLQRLREREFWAKLVKGGVGLQAVRGLAASLRAMRGGKPSRQGASTSEKPFQERMLMGAEAFVGPLWLALSGRDLTAQEFVDHVSGSARWQRVLDSGRCRRMDLAHADHTFSDIAEMERLHADFAAWLRQQWPTRPATAKPLATGQEPCLV